MTAYALASLWAYWSVDPLAGRRVPTCGCGDIAQHVWFLGWTAHALTHGLNPFFSSAINVPAGVNLASNTSFPLLGALATPLTLIRGPVASYDLLMVLAFLSSATAMYCVLRRWTRWWPAAFAGGLLYGFSPYMIGQGNGHLNLLFVPIPPLVLAVLDDVLVRGRRSARWNGIALGLLGAAQYLISSEILVDTALTALIGVAVLAVGRRSLVAGRIRRVVSTAPWALVPFALFAGFPAWFTFAGPQHVSQPWWPPAQNGAGGSDLLGPIVPTTSQLWNGGHWATLGSALGPRNPVENGIYLGIPLLAVLLVFVVLYRKDGVVRFAAVMAAMTFLVSTGTTLAFDGRPTGLPAPFGWLYRLPLLDNLLASRLSLFTQLFAALLLAVGLDRSWSRLHAPRAGVRRSGAGGHRRTAGRPYVAAAGALAIAVVALAPLVPRLPYPSTGTGVPSYFTTDSSHGVSHIPHGSTVLTYPYPYNPVNYAMLWQAVSSFRFDIIGDYAIVPASPGSSRGSLAPPTLDPPTTEILFDDAAARVANSPMPPFAPPTFRSIRALLVRYRVGTVIVAPLGAHPATVVRYLTAALGASPVHVGGVAVWYHVERSVRPGADASRSPG
ncbi:MAG: hypothetical protein M0007_02920 [Actinomycetota bacterium]|nr:hypothetical protein [Actinomycetota bacterium]